MNHQEISELLGPFALDAVEPEEAEVVAAHMRDCPRCQAEHGQHLEVACLLGNEWRPAPDGVWDRIANSLFEAPPRALGGVGRSGDQAAERRRFQALVGMGGPGSPSGCWALGPAPWPLPWDRRRGRRLSPSLLKGPAAWSLASTSRSRPAPFPHEVSKLPVADELDPGSLG